MCLHLSRTGSGRFIQAAAVAVAQAAANTGSIQPLQLPRPGPPEPLDQLHIASPQMQGQAGAHLPILSPQHLRNPTFGGPPAAAAAARPQEPLAPTLRQPRSPAEFSSSPVPSPTARSPGTTPVEAAEPPQSSAVPAAAGPGIEAAPAPPEEDAERKEGAGMAEEAVAEEATPEVEVAPEETTAEEATAEQGEVKAEGVIAPTVARGRGRGRRSRWRGRGRGRTRSRSATPTPDTLKTTGFDGESSCPTAQGSCDSSYWHPPFLHM
jgi:hypothetical protein